MNRYPIIASLLTLAFAFGLIGISAQPADAATSCTPGTYWTGAGNTNARAGASTTARIVQVLAPRTEVEVTGERNGTSFANSTLWCEVALGTRTAYVHSSLLTTVQPTAPVTSNSTTGSTGTTTNPPVQQNGLQSPAPQPTSAPVQQPAASFQCPRNCAGAVAMGLTAQQAATCPGLDRDRDGVACYGD